jgi:hypothetical protein
VVLGYSCYLSEGLPTAPLEQRLQVAFDAICEQRLSHHVVVTGGQSDTRWPSEAEIMAHWLMLRLLSDKPPPSLPPQHDEPQWHSDLWRTVRSRDTISLVAENSACAGHHVTLVMEKESTSTITNARNALGILRDAFPDIKHILVVTSLFHQYRSRKVFEKYARDLELDASNQQATATATVTATRGSTHKYSFEMAHVPAPANNCVTQKDFVRELAAIALYFVARWI